MREDPTAKGVDMSSPATTPRSNVVSEQAPGGCVRAWIRESGDLFGVTLLPDVGHGHSFTSDEGHAGFPSSYDAPALFAWARKRWPDKDLMTDLKAELPSGGEHTAPTTSPAESRPWSAHAELEHAAPTFAESCSPVCHPLRRTDELSTKKVSQLTGPSKYSPPTFEPRTRPERRRTGL